MSRFVTIRLQAGPFDGFREHDVLRLELPEHLHVERCRICTCHLWIEPSSRSELYRRDEERKGEVIYVWTDQPLDPLMRKTEREKVTA